MIPAWRAEDCPPYLLPPSLGHHSQTGPTRFPLAADKTRVPQSQPSRCLRSLPFPSRNPASQAVYHHFPAIHWPPALDQYAYYIVTTSLLHRGLWLLVPDAGHRIGSLWPSPVGTAEPNRKHERGGQLRPPLGTALWPFRPSDFGLRTSDFRPRLPHKKRRGT
jgi:hypothetical protein